MKIKERNNKVVVKYYNEVVQFPLGKQQTYVDWSIQSKVWVYTHINPPQEKTDLWSEKGYKSVRKLSNSKENPNLHKALWQVLFNEPDMLIVYAKEMNDYLWNIVKFSLQNNIKVAIELTDVPHKEVISPVTNLKKHPLFKNTKVEELINSNDKRSEIRDKYDLLLGLRENYKAQEVYPQLYAALKELYTADKRHQEEVNYEKYCIGIRYHLRDNVIPAYKQAGLMPQNMSLDLLSNDNIRKVKDKLAKVASYYDIDLSLEEFSSSADSIRRQKDYKHNVENPSERIAVRGRINNVGSMSSLPEIIDAYKQISYYQDNNITEGENQDVLTMSNALCPHCQKANFLKSARRNWEIYGDPKNYCIDCEAVLPDLPVEVDFCGEEKAYYQSNSKEGVQIDS